MTFPVKQARQRGYVPGKGPGNGRRFGNGPPMDEPWMWETAEMLRSPAWREMTLNARMVLDRIRLEHMAHAGTMNGLLAVTHNDFAAYGIRKKSIKQAIEIAKALGWIDVAEPGHRSYGGVKRPTKYALTYLPRHDGSPKTDRWKKMDEITAAQLVKAIRAATPSTERRACMPLVAHRV